MAEVIDAPELTYELGKSKLTAKFTNAGIYLSCADIQKIIGCRLSDLVYYARMQDLVILPTTLLIMVANSGGVKSCLRLVFSR